MQRVDAFHLAIYNNDLDHAQKEVEFVRQNFSTFADQIGAPLEVAQIVIDYLGQAPTSELLSSTLSEKMFHHIADDPLLNASKTRIPSILIDACFVASLTMHRTGDDTIFSLLLASNAPLMNTFSVNPYSVTTDALQRQYTAGQLTIFQRQMSLMATSNERVAQYKKFFSRQSGYEPLLVLENRIVTMQFEYLSSHGDIILDTLTPFRMLTEIATREYLGIPLARSTTLALCTMNKIKEEIEKHMGAKSLLFLKYSTIQSTLIAHAQSFSKEEIRYARSQVCLLIDAGAIKPIYDSLQQSMEKSFNRHESLTHFHLTDETLLEQTEGGGMHFYRNMLQDYSYPPIGRAPFEYEMAKESLWDDLINDFDLSDDE